MDEGNMQALKLRRFELWIAKLIARVTGEK